MKQKIVITGGAGFIGSNLAHLLLMEGFHVTVIDNLSAGTRENLPSAVEFICCDIRQDGLERYLEGATDLFHLAARNCLPDCANHPVETVETNVVGTVNVLKSCNAAKVSHVIYADTSAEYEGSDIFPSPTEMVSPMSVYASSKRAGALMAEAFARMHAMTLSTVRYFNAYGPAQDWRRVIPPVMSAFTLKLLREESPNIFGDGSKRRDFIHVDDINAFHLKLLREPELRGQTYNLGSGKDYSVREVFEKIRLAVGNQIEPKYLPDLPGEAQRTLADIQTTLATGWTPRVELEQGIATFVEWMRNKFITSHQSVSGSGS